MKPKEIGFTFGNMIAGWFGNKEIKNEDNYKTFSPLKVACKTYESFLTQMKTKTGILILYANDRINQMSDLVNEISKDEYTLQIVISHKVIYPVMQTTEEGKILVEQLKCTVFPSIFITRLTKNNSHIAVYGILNKDINKESLGTLLLDFNAAYLFHNAKPKQGGYVPRIQKVYPPLMQPVIHPNNRPFISNQQDPLLSHVQFFNPFFPGIPIAQHTQLSQIHGNSNNNNNNNASNSNSNNKQIDLNDPRLYEDLGDDKYLYNEFEPQSNSDIIEQQKKDFERLERQEEDKKKEEKCLEELKKKELKEQEEKKNELRKKRDALPKEPDDSNPDKTKILFRFPDGLQNIERKFLKSDKIQLLYDFVDSLGKEIYTEQEYNQFILVQTTSRLKNAKIKRILLNKKDCFLT